MALVTEATLRDQFSAGAPVGRYQVPPGTVVTPSARAWLVDHHVDLVIGDKVVSTATHPSGTPVNDKTAGLPAGSPPVSALPVFFRPEHFDVIDGSQVEDKPEHLTALRGNLLVPKNHPQIRFRGMIDALEADIVAAQGVFRRLGLEKGVTDLGGILDYVKQVLRCEVLDVPFDDPKVLGWDEAALRQYSHYPQQLFGLVHFAASVDDGEAVAVLNQLRTTSRQVELAAYDAFTTGEQTEPTRVDLIRAMNRLSSALYLMMFKAKVGNYS